MNKTSRKKALLCATAIIGFGYAASSSEKAFADVVLYMADSSNTSIQTIGLAQSYLGNSVLANPSALAPGSNNFNYAVILFTPTTTNTYTFGQRSSPSDTIMILYEGIFDPTNPGQGAVVGNDDTSASLHQTALGSSGAIQCGPNTNYCPQISYNFITGHTYSLFVSSYSTSYNGVFALPFEFYSTGDVVFGAYTGRTPINLAQPFYVASQLDITVDPIFVGGTLRMDQAGTTYAQDFTLANMASSTIDQNGNHSIFSGIFSDALAGSPGNITIDNSASGGSVTFSAINTYTGTTTLKGGVLSISQNANLGDAIANVVFDGGTLLTTASFISDRQIELASTGTIMVAPDTTLALTTGVSGTGSWTKAGAGTLVLTADNTYTGLTTVSGGVLAIGNSDSPGATLSGGGGVLVEAGAILGGYGSVTGTVSNGGTIAAGSALNSFSGGPFGNFTVIGNYTGLGNLAIRTQLNADDSPSDQLVISGADHTTSGLTNIIVTNAGGLGSFTVGNGIRVVATADGATTGAGSFALGAPAVAGPYEYSLYHGALDGSDPNSWYLRNDRPNSPTPLIADYRSEVSLYSTAQSQAQVYGRALLDTLHERSGELDSRVITTGQQASTDVNSGYVGWGRFIGQHNSRSNGAGIYSRDGAAFDQDIYAFQFGMDLMRREHADGSRDHAGIYAAVGQSKADVTHYTGAHAGRNTLDAYTAGAYWTHYGAKGWYVDAVTQATQYSADLHSSRGFQLKTDGYGLAASLEAGYGFKFGNGLVIEPQAQIVYQHISFDNGSDSAARVWFDDANSLAGRIGMRVRKDWTLNESDKNPRILTTWARANLWHEFLGDNKVSFSSLNGPVAFSSDMGGSWMELQVGVSTQLSASSSIFASGSYQLGLSGDQHAYNGKVGLRINW